MWTIGPIGTQQRSPFQQVHSLPPHANTSSPPYNATAVARTWSDGGVPTQRRTFGQSQYDEHPHPFPGADASPQRGAEAQKRGYLPRPAMVKRDTSSQNESYETKPSRIKKAALNRDQSATSNRLKRQYILEVFNKDMQSLHEKTEQIRLSSPLPDIGGTTLKPAPLDMGARQSTVDALEQAMSKYLFDQTLPQPAPLSKGDRKNTMDELGYDLIDDDDVPNEDIKSVDDPKLPPSKPLKLTQADRLTTTEFMKTVNAPLLTTDDKSDDESPLPL